MRFFSSILSAVIALLALAFALSNRQSVEVSLWPFGVTVQAPLYLFSLGTLLFGMMLGALVTWFSMLPHRFAARRLQKDILKLNEKIENLQQTVLPPERGLTLAAPKWQFWKKS